MKAVHVLGFVLSARVAMEVYAIPTVQTAKNVKMARVLINAPLVKNVVRGVVFHYVMIRVLSV